MHLLVILTGFAALATPCCYGQSDPFPDQFDSPNTELFPQPKTKEGGAAKAGKVRFDGQVTLPYSLRCAGQRLLPGRYTILLRSDGKTGRATLTRKGQSFEIRGVARLPADTHAHNRLLVECIGKARMLAAIHVEEMELVFAADPQLEHTPDGQPKRTERLLLTRMSPMK